MNRWFPTKKQLSDLETLERTLRQVLTQHYALVDAHAKTVAALADAQAKLNAPPPLFPPGNGPLDTMMLGLPVTPVDAKSLANGATLKWNTAKGQFEFV